MKIQLDKRFKKNIAGRFGKYTFEVGVLQDKPHREPIGDLVLKDGKVEYATKQVKSGEFKGENVFVEKSLGTYAGGPVRKASRKSSKSVAEVSKSLRENLGVNYLTEPFKKQSSDIVKFSREFFKLAFGRSEKRRCENLLQAIVRNPMLRGDYGTNAELTQKIKGFDRKTIDTAQLFKNIKAICKVKGG